MFDKTNIILIGMPGVGKSTAGVQLAKLLGKYFLDADVYIQILEEKSLQEIIDARGMQEFCRIEEEYLSCIDCKNAVIATGGSAVYSTKAMEHLKADGVVIHLDLSLDKIKKRITDLPTRGVVMEPGEMLETLFEKRQPLYQKWADVTIDCENMTSQQVVSTILNRIN